MRNFTLKELETPREIIREINFKVLQKRADGRNIKKRNKSSIEINIVCTRCLERWKRLMNQGKIFFQGSRHWLMEWDD